MSIVRYQVPSTGVGSNWTNNGAVNWTGGTTPTPLAASAYHPGCSFSFNDANTTNQSCEIVSTFTDGHAGYFAASIPFWAQGAPTVVIYFSGTNGFAIAIDANGFHLQDRSNGNSVLTSVNPPSFPFNQWNLLFWTISTSGGNDSIHVGVRNLTTGNYVDGSGSNTSTPSYMINTTRAAHCVDGTIAILGFNDTGIVAVGDLWLGGSASGSPTISPTSVSLNTNATQQFTFDGYDGALYNPSAIDGTISTLGLYTAPSSGTTDTVSAPEYIGSGTASSAITILSSTVSGVTVSPSTVTMDARGTQTFTATVAGTGSPSQSVTWSAVHGTINGSGAYVGPAASLSGQSDTVTATSVQDGSKSGTATVTITAATVSSVTINPTTATEAQAFASTVTGTHSPSTTVNWTTNLGTIDSSGNYTPAALTSSIQTGTVTATSALDTSKSAVANITLPVSPPTVVATTSWNAGTPFKGGTSGVSVGVTIYTLSGTDSGVTKTSLIARTTSVLESISNTTGDYIYRFNVPPGNDVLAVWDSGESPTPTYYMDEFVVVGASASTVTLDLTQTVPMSNTAGTVGDALNGARAEAFGKAVYDPVGKTFTVYASDNNTVLKSFTVTTDTNGNILQRA